MNGFAFCFAALFRACMYCRSFLTQYDRRKVILRFILDEQFSVRSGGMERSVTEIRKFRIPTVPCLF